MKNVLVVGAGAAGIMAALAAAEAGAAVRLFEKNDIVGKKMGITGKGRCNLTNSCSMAEFISHTPGNGRFLFSAYRQFTNRDLMARVTAWGLPLKEERGGRIFPCSDSAVEVRRLFYRQLREHRVQIHFNETVERLWREAGGWQVETVKGRYAAEACIITTGGVSYPVTGSTGDGHRFAAALGHSVSCLKPSLIPFVTAEAWPGDLAGLSLRNVAGTLWQKGKKIDTRFGEMLFTHFGVSGPIILMLSAAAAHGKDIVFPLELTLNLKPALTKEKLDARVQRDLQQYVRKQMGNALNDLLPQRLIPVVLRQAGIEAKLPVSQLTKERRQDLVETLQELHLTITATRPVSEAIVTAGGVSVKEINPQTMESKVVPQLYFAGEVLDIDAFTGGYNLQAAFSTGFVAGKAAAEEIAE
ncbi:NAD(P)/FAD-dependent oxidoreductase [Megasphaera vaginalis (ex Bordigoni et al. 2020)]|uniref:NAD(P)/FAD-dependent oxidoreductase n=1 Tax=Megasphaera vaginalis (ex Bordigoni et al. 2020) TaxID=2045301 RepID=UPI000C7994C4|nr:NAD(P)/FAD-dependent oxidoreductase [Megasphaera vaginalis (ex Bordigoni et al. 2020)]